MCTNILHVLYRHITHTRVLIIKNLHNSLLQKTLEIFDIHCVYQDIIRTIQAHYTHSSHYYKKTLIIRFYKRHWGYLIYTMYTKILYVLYRNITHSRVVPKYYTYYIGTLHILESLLQKTLVYRC